MVRVDKYFLQPTKLIPNSPYPLLHYKGVFPERERRPERINNVFHENDWETQWIIRYARTQPAHYHSAVHECMVVLTGTATIRFGVADTDHDLDKSTWAGASENGGVDVCAEAGDVFVIPAGVAHKTHNTSPAAPFGILSPGEGRGIQAPDVNEALSKIELSGLTMIGAYPKDSGDWDFSVGGESVGNFEAIWNVARPEKDPVLGVSLDGLVSLWKDVPIPT